MVAVPVTWPCTDTASTSLSYLDHRPGQRSSECLGPPGIFGVLGFWDLTRGPPRVSFGPRRDSQILSFHCSEQAQRPARVAGQPFLCRHQVELLQSSGPQAGSRCSVLICSLAAAEGCGCGCRSYCCWWGDHTPTRGMPQVAEKKKIEEGRVASVIGQTHSYATLTVHFQTFHTNEGHLKKNWKACITDRKFKGVSMV